jgi:hypothetical protein
MQPEDSSANTGMGNIVILAFAGLCQLQSLPIQIIASQVQNQSGIGDRHDKKSYALTNTTVTNGSHGPNGTNVP